MDFSALGSTGGTHGTTPDPPVNSKFLLTMFLARLHLTISTRLTKVPLSGVVTSQEFLSIHLQLFIFAIAEGHN